MSLNTSNKQKQLKLIMMPPCSALSTRLGTERLKANLVSLVNYLDCFFSSSAYITYMQFVLGCTCTLKLIISSLVGWVPSAIYYFVACGYILYIPRLPHLHSVPKHQVRTSSDPLLVYPMQGPQRSTYHLMARQMMGKSELALQGCDLIQKLYVGIPSCCATW